jgi:uncharacterized protein (TIRG00374 family)
MATQADKDGPGFPPTVPTMQDGKARFRWLLIPQIIAGAGIIAFVLWRADLRETARVIGDANYIYLLIALPLYLLAYLFWSYRSRLSLRRLGHISLPTLFELYMAANMVNLILPMRMGDLLRVRILSRRFGFRPGAVMTSVFVTETLFDGIIFALLFLWVLALEGVPQVLLGLAWTLFAVVAVALVLAASTSRLQLREGWEERGSLRKLPPAARRIVSRVLPEVIDGLFLLKDIPLAARALVATLSAWLVQAAVYYVYARVFGIDISPAEAVVVMLTVALIASVPIVPTGLGTYEAGVTGVLLLFGAGKGEALAYAVGSHVLSLAFALVVGTAGLLLLRIRPSDIVHLRQGVDHEAGQAID